MTKLSANVFGFICFPLAQFEIDFDAPWSSRFEPA
jgi:hypothetical protein